MMIPSPTMIKIETFPACEQTLLLGMLREVTRERHAKGDARKGVALAYSLAARFSLPLRNRELSRGL